MNFIQCILITSPPLLQPSPDSPLPSIPTQTLFQSSMYCLCTLWCETTQRGTVNLPTATPLKKTSSPSHNNYELPIAPQRVGLSAPLPHSGIFCLTWDCTGFASPFLIFSFFPSNGNLFSEEEWDNIKTEPSGRCGPLTNATVCPSKRVNGSAIPRKSQFLKRVFVLRVCVFFLDIVYTLYACLVPTEAGSGEQIPWKWSDRFVSNHVDAGNWS